MVASGSTVNLELSKGKQSKSKNGQKSIQRRMSMNSLTSQNTPARSSLEETKLMNQTKKVGVDSITQLLNQSIFNNRKQSVKSFVTKPQTSKPQTHTFKQSPPRQQPLLHRKMSQPTLQSSFPKGLNKENSQKKSSGQHLFLNISSVVNQDRLKYSESLKSSEDERLLLSQDLNSQPTSSNLTSSISIMPRSSILSTQPIRKSDDLVETGGIHSSQKNPVTLQSTQVLTRRRMSQSQFEQEMFNIQMQQKEREQTLIQKFNHLKVVAQETIKLNQKAMLSATQPFEAYEQRMQKFEMMIDLLLDRNGVDTQARDRMQRAQSQGLLLGGTQNFAIGRDAFYMSSGQLGGSMVIPEGKNSFKDERRSSGCGSPLIPPSMHNVNVATSIPGVQTLCINLQDDNYCSSSASTHDQRMVFNRHSSLLSHRSGAQSTDNDKRPVSVPRQRRLQNREDDDQDTPQQILSSQMNPGRLHQSFSKKQINQNLNKQPQNQDGLKGFIETLQTIEDYKNHPQTPEDLDYLKGKLLCYRDQLNSINNVENQQTQRQIVQAIEVIIQKMELENPHGDFYGHKIVELERQGTNNVESSILIDKTNTHMDLTRTPKQAIEIYDDGRQDTQHLDYGGDVTDNSILLSTRKSHPKYCNKSGYQVKHSRYLSDVDHYQVIHHPLQTNEEHDKSWLQEIKHLKALLGSMALNHSNDKIMHSYIVDNERKRSGLPKDLSKNSQCIIF